MSVEYCPLTFKDQLIASYMSLDLQNRSNHTKIKIQCNLSLKLHSCTIQGHHAGIYIWLQMTKCAFTAGFLSILSNHEGALQGLWSQKWMCVVLRCFQRLFLIIYAVNCVHLVKTQRCFLLGLQLLTLSSSIPPNLHMCHS